jgi:hypothetical protein
MTHIEDPAGSPAAREDERKGSNFATTAVSRQAPLPVRPVELADGARPADTPISSRGPGPTETTDCRHPTGRTYGQRGRSRRRQSFPDTLPDGDQLQLVVDDVARQVGDLARLGGQAAPEVAVPFPRPTVLVANPSRRRSLRADVTSRRLRPDARMGRSDSRRRARRPRLRTRRSCRRRSGTGARPPWPPSADRRRSSDPGGGADAVVPASTPAWCGLDRVLLARPPCSTRPVEARRALSRSPRMLPFDGVAPLLAARARLVHHATPRRQPAGAVRPPQSPCRQSEPGR